MFSVAVTLNTTYHTVLAPQYGLSVLLKNTKSKYIEWRMLVGCIQSLQFDSGLWSQSWCSRSYWLKLVSQLMLSQLFESEYFTTYRQRRRHQYGRYGNCHTWGFEYFKNRWHSGQNPVTQGQKRRENWQKTSHLGKKKQVSASLPSLPKWVYAAPDFIKWTTTAII